MNFLDNQIHFLLKLHYRSDVFYQTINRKLCSCRARSENDMTGIISCIEIQTRWRCHDVQFFLYFFGIGTILLQNYRLYIFYQGLNWQHIKCKKSNINKILGFVRNIAIHNGQKRLEKSNRLDFSIFKLMFPCFFKTIHPIFSIKLSFYNFFCRNFSNWFLLTLHEMKKWWAVDAKSASSTELLLILQIFFYQGLNVHFSEQKWFQW